MKSEYQAYVSLVQTAAKTMFERRDSVNHKPTASLSDMQSMKKAKEASGIVGKAKFLGMDDELAVYELDFSF